MQLTQTISNQQNFITRDIYGFEYNDESKQKFESPL